MYIYIYVYILMYILPIRKASNMSLAGTIPAKTRSKGCEEGICHCVFSEPLSVSRCIEKLLELALCQNLRGLLHNVSGWQVEWGKKST